MPDSSLQMRSRVSTNVSSALWAAYGDALGFPTELASPSLIRQRLGSTESKVLKSWPRLVGGRFGTQVSLVAGAYSDDTQLRLAVGRTIRADGSFDVEAFAKIELPIWLCYALGAGRGSKAAATSLSGRNINWFSNFFDTNGIKYVQGGGNGAAMRVQPHVWCARSLDEASFMPDVVRNAVCTHGHVRGIAGAMIHAAILARTMKLGSIPEPEEWMDFALTVQTLPAIVSSDNELSTFWRPTWEKQSDISLESATLEVADEWANAVGVTVGLLGSDAESTYKTIVAALDGLSDSQRGSGLKASLFSLVGAWLFRHQDPGYGLAVIANTLESDTDTIGTMAGALLGSRPGCPLPEDPIQDKQYLISEAQRFAAISERRPTNSFNYPDLLYWQAPKTSLDSVGQSSGNKLALAGLGLAAPLSEEISASPKGTVWQWLTLEFGQSILCKRRRALPQLPDLAFAQPSLIKSPSAITEKSPKNFRQTEASTPESDDLFSTSHGSHKLSQEKMEQSVDELTDQAIKSGFRPELIGRHLLELADREYAIEKAIAYAAIIAKARLARARRGGSS